MLQSIQANAQAIADLTALIGRTSTPVPQRPITPPSAGSMDVDVAIPATPLKELPVARATPGAKPNEDGRGLLPGSRGR